MLGLIIYCAIIAANLGMATAAMMVTRGWLRLAGALPIVAAVGWGAYILFRFQRDGYSQNNWAFDALIFSAGGFFFSLVLILISSVLGSGRKASTS